MAEQRGCGDGTTDRNGTLTIGGRDSQMEWEERTVWRWMPRMASGMTLTVEGLQEDVAPVAAN